MAACYDMMFLSFLGGIGRVVFYHTNHGMLSYTTVSAAWSKALAVIFLGCMFPFRLGQAEIPLLRFCGAADSIHFVGVQLVTT